MSLEYTRNYLLCLTEHLHCIRAAKYTVDGGARGMREVFRSEETMKFAKLISVTGTMMIIVLALVSTLPAQTQILTVLHNFAGRPTDGAKPTGGLLFDPAGNLYGVTSNGGAANSGTVFKLDPNGTESVIYSFAGPPDGNLPSAGLARDAAGNLYGVTSNGGSSTPCPFLIGCGIVFRLDPAGTETVLHRFGSNGTDGTGPQGRLILDNSLNLFGTTEMGGQAGCKIFIGKILEDVHCGTVFKVDANGNESIVYSFINSTDGAVPLAGLVQDSSGNLFGTASTGGVMNCTALFSKCGTVFKVDTAGAFSMLYPFQGASAGPDGATPLSSCCWMRRAISSEPPSSGARELRVPWDSPVARSSR